MHGAAEQIPLFPADEPVDAVDGLTVRESGRAKRLSIKVFPRGRVEVVVPKRTHARDVAAFVEENREWIARSRAAFAKEHPPEPFALPAFISLPAIGRRYTVRYEQIAGKSTVRIREASPGILCLHGNTGDETQCVAALKRWLASTARKAFEPKLKSLAQLTGNPYKRMHVRGQKTCWGSRSSSGTISINYSLLFLAPAVVRYLMVHELCHGVHMNHSRRFWALVARHEPGYRQLDRELSAGWKSVPSWLGFY